MPAEPSNNGSASLTDDHGREFENLERLAKTSESERVRILQEFAAVESTNGILSAEVARLKDQVEAARGKLRNLWDFIFRLRAKHVAELAKLEAVSTTSGLPKLRAALADLQRQNNSLRLENAERKQAGERMSAELAKRKAETIQLARERDEVRSKIARCLTSKLWLLKRLFQL
jgi:chromosome segregation ATPase